MAAAGERVAGEYVEALARCGHKGTGYRIINQPREVPMTPIYALAWGLILLFGASAVLALVWAVERGQLRNFERAARTIFDEDEPVGTLTDRFPSLPSRAPAPQGASEDRQ
jgi:nitrogen fixation-related uncharacterized protein